jgi:hypothetical protein
MPPGLTPDRVRALLEKPTTPPLREVLDIPKAPTPPPAPKRAAKPKPCPSPDVVRAIRDRVAKGEPQLRLAFEFDLSQPAVSRIARGLAYESDGGPITRRNASPIQHHLRKLAPDKVERMRVEYSSGLFTIGDLARRYHVHHATANRILTGQSYQDCPGPTFYIKPRPMHR